MTKRGPKEGKVDVAEAGRGSALKHNPFAGLRAGVETPAAAPSANPAAPLDAGSPVSGEPTGAAQKSRGRLVLRRETKRRGGKAVVVVAGLRANAHLAESEIAALAQRVKQQLGCGGTIERVANDTELVVQGDQPARVAELLRAMGFKVDGVTA